MRRKRILIAAGGTGGHFYPGFALAQAFKERGWQPLVALRPGSAGDALLEQAGIPAAAVDLEGLPRSLSLKLPRFGLKLAKSAWAAHRLVADFKPDAAVGMGGYVSVPCLWAARRAGVPTAVHESNAILGLANRLCRGLGAKVFWGLPPKGGLKGGEALVGTPIRAELRTPAPREESRRKLGLDTAASTPILLVFGGSQGAQTLNRAVPEILKTLAAKAPDAALQVIHVSGEKWLEDTRGRYAGASFKALVLPYITAMEQAYGAADLVLCRSGASTLAELIAQKKPAVLVPYPHAAADHQSRNAAVIEAAGAARAVEEKNLGQALPAVLNSLLLEPEAAAHRRSMSEGCARLALPAPSEAVPALVRAVEALAG